MNATRLLFGSSLGADLVGSRYMRGLPHVRGRIDHIRVVEHIRHQIFVDELAESHDRQGGIPHRYEHSRIPCLGSDLIFRRE